MELDVFTVLTAVLCLCFSVLEYLGEMLSFLEMRKFLVTPLAPGGAEGGVRLVLTKIYTVSSVTFLISRVAASRLNFPTTVKSSNVEKKVLEF